MVKSLVAVAVLLVSIVGSSSADAKTHSGKLVVCSDYKVVADKGAEDRPIAICFDSEKPTVLRYFTEVTVSTSEGPAKVAIGSR